MYYQKVAPGHYVQKDDSTLDPNEPRVIELRQGLVILASFKVKRVRDKTHIRRTAPYANSRISLKGVHIAAKRRVMQPKKRSERQNKK